jgi:hypothetical protein
MISSASFFILSTILFGLLLRQKALNDARTQSPAKRWYLLEHCLKEFQVKAAQHRAPPAQELLQQFFVREDQKFALRLVTLPEMLAEHNK